MAHIAIYPNNARRFDQIFAYLTVATDPASISAEDVLTQEHLDVLAEVLDSWPLESRWPGELMSRPITIFQRRLKYICSSSRCCTPRVCVLVQRFFKSRLKAAVL
jgi:hypothetical protein